MGPSVRLLLMSGVTVPSTGEFGVLLLDGIIQANPYTLVHCLLPSHSISFTTQVVSVCKKDREN